MAPTPEPDYADINDPDRRRRGTILKVVVYALIIVGLLILILMVTGVLGGEHGPSRHGPGDGGTDTTPPPGHTPPFEH